MFLPLPLRQLASQRVLIVGMGGLGCPVSLALAQAGVGHLSLADPDRVEPSNLPRQLWHRPQNLGALKVASAGEGLRRAFPRLGLQEVPQAVSEENAPALFAGHDLVVDATDGVETKFLLSDAAVKCGIPLVYAGVVQLAGQAMVIRPGGPCLRCFFEVPEEGSLPTCAAAGVLGSVAGWVGGVAAQLALEVLGGDSSGGVLHLVDGKRFRSRKVQVRPSPDCPACAGALPLPPVKRVEACRTPAAAASRSPIASTVPLLDIRADACPMTYVRTKLAMDRLQKGEVLEVLLEEGSEAVRNVPRSAQEEGHEILALEAWPEGGMKLSLRKGAP